MSLVIRLTYEGLAFGGETIRFRAVSTESKRGELGTRALLDQALNFKEPSGKLW